MKQPPTSKFAILGLDNSNPAHGGGYGSSQISCCLDAGGDRKSTRLNSSHGYISYAVFCFKKKDHGASRQSPGHFLAKCRAELNLHQNLAPARAVQARSLRAVTAALFLRTAFRMAGSRSLR